MSAIVVSSGALAVSDLITIEGGEPRVMDRRLAEALGFDRQRNIRRLIERHLEALRRLGEVRSIVEQTSEKGGRPGKAYWLTRKQAIFLCTKSETEKATEITIQVVEVFDEALDAGRDAGLTLDRQGLALFRLNGRSVLVDTSRWQVVNEKALVIRNDGRFAIERATYEQTDRPRPHGPRFGWGPWKKYRNGHAGGASAGRDGIWIIGAVVEMAPPQSVPSLAVARH